MKNINFSGIRHLPKSPMAYATNINTLCIYLETSKDDVDRVEIIFGDPFDYEEVDFKYIWKISRDKPTIMKKTYFNKYSDFYFQEISTHTRRTKYAFLIIKDEKKYFYGSRGLKEVTDSKLIYDSKEYFNYPDINESDLITSPSWVKDTIWYQIFPERFCRLGPRSSFLPWNSIKSNVKNEDLFGGNIKGMKSKIPYLKDLGINGIYLTPIFHASSSHKYDTINYFQIDPQFGTNQDFYEFVEECHQAGIKVVLDAVFNHCGFFHPFFQDVIKNKQKSPYWDYFYIEDENFIDFQITDEGKPVIPKNHRPKYRTFAYTLMMPKLNTNNPEVINYLLEVGKYWVKEFDIDGWRLDVSNEVSHKFWRHFRDTLKEIKSDLYIVGENWDDSNPWLQGDQFDAVMNYELAYPLWKFFGNEEDSISGEEFVYLINNLLIKYPKNISINMYNLLDSHDTIRMLSRVRNNKDLLKMAFVFLFSFAGSPSIYYGDEIGLLGGEDPDCRRCMIWDKEMQDLELFQFFKRLIQIRKDNPDLKTVDINWLEIDGNFICYQKENTIIIINNNPIKKTYNLKQPCLDLESKAEYTKEILVKPFGYQILRVK